MFGFILMLIVGGLIGWIAGGIVGKDIPGGILGNIIAGVVGAAVGSWIFGDWGWHLGGIAIFPALLGTIILVAVVSFIFGKFRKK
ncbi:membrane protein [Staphylococcus xylosus]|uniref:GlsB/YeaQ/YmgE family stress response membrane protein n=1 Tax=Staphylococcus xylosus TaxID=1288 RepID=UPI00049AE0F2|nr:GlsB/YeaQ/YmgE family stress response membrane protein [Staphylococcus xylosus]AID00775.1 membrane protein [Staphylococcus xylosus]